MADPKTADKQKASMELSEPTSVAELYVDDLIVALHQKAIESVKSFGDFTIQNSAIEGDGSKAEFYGAGSHIVAAIPKDPNKTPKIPKATAFEMLKTYIQWFSGPDIAGKLTIDKLAELNPDDKKSEEKNESIIPTFSQYLLLEAGEAPTDDKPADGDDDKKGDEPADGKDGDKSEGGKDDKPKDDKTDKDKKPEDDKKKDDKEEKGNGYFVNYKIQIAGEKEHPIADALKKFGKDLLKGFGVKLGSWRTAGSGEAHTLGGLVDDLKGIFGSIDPDKFKANFDKNLKAKLPQTTTSSELFDKATLMRVLKSKLDGKEKSKVKTADYSFCVKVARNDKSRKVVNVQFIADLITKSITGIYKKFKNKVNKNDVILVNDYDENDRTKNKAAKQLSPDTNDESILPLAGNLLTEESDGSEGSSEGDGGDAGSEGSDKGSSEGGDKPEDKAPIETVLKDMQDYLQKQVDGKFSKAKKHEASIKDANEVVDYITKVAETDEKIFNTIKKHKYAFMIEIEAEKPKESAESAEGAPAKESISVLHASNDLLRLLFEAIDSSDPNKVAIEKIFSNLANNAKFLEATGKKEPEENEIYAFDVEAVKSESMKQIKNVYKFIFEDEDAYCILEDMLLEGHAEEQKTLISQIKRIGAENFTKNINEITKEYRKKLADVLNKHKDNEYLKKSIEIVNGKNTANSEHWIDKEFVRQARDLKTVDAILKLLDEVVSKRVGKTEDKKYELDALANVLEKYPDDPNKEEDNVKLVFKAPKDPAEPDGDLQQLGDPVEFKKGEEPKAPEPPKFDGYEFERWDPDPKTLEDPEDEQEIVATYKKSDDEKITITFKDIDDPSELDDPSKLSDDDKKKYKDLGEPLELVPGEDVKEPEVKNKGKWEFMGFEPDPRDMDKTGDTYAMYEKNGPDTVEIKFYEANPEKNEKTGEPIKTIEVEEGQPVNSTDEGKDAFEELNKKFDDEKKDGFERKGWNQDPATKAEKDLEFYPKYIGDDDKDKEFTVVFQYPPDPEKEDNVEEIEGDLGTQKIKAGESAKAPEPPEIDGWKFKEWSDDFSNVTDDMTVIAKYQKPIKFIFKVPKDPEKPDDLEQLGDPIEFEEGKEITPPDPPDFKDDGYEFEKWDPDPKELKDPEGDQEIVAKYKKNKPEGKFIFKAPKDPEKPDDLQQLGDPIEFEEGKEVTPPDPPDFKDSGYEFEKWDPDPKELKEAPEEDKDIVAVYKKSDGEESGDMMHTIYVLPDYGGLLDETSKPMIKIVFKAPELNKEDPQSTDMDKTTPIGDPVEVQKDTPIEVGKDGTLTQAGKELVKPRDLSEAGYVFDKWEPDPAKGFSEDADVDATYKQDKNKKAATKDLKGDGYDFYVIPMKGLKPKNSDDEENTK